MERRATYYVLHTFMKQYFVMIQDDEAAMCDGNMYKCRSDCCCCKEEKEWVKIVNECGECFVEFCRMYRDGMME